MISRITNLRETLGLIKDDIDVSKRKGKASPGYNSISGISPEKDEERKVAKDSSGKKASPLKVTEKSRSGNHEDVRRILQEESRQEKMQLVPLSQAADRDRPEGYIPIPEHETIVREEIGKVEQYYKDMLSREEAEHDAKLRLVKEEYEEKLGLATKAEVPLIDVSLYFSHPNHVLLTPIRKPKSFLSYKANMNNNSKTCSTSSSRERENIQKQKKKSRGSHPS